MQMRHTDEEVERAAARFEQFADELAPASARVVTTDDLRSVAEAARAVRDDEAVRRQGAQLSRSVRTRTATATGLRGSRCPLLLPRSVQPPMPSVTDSCPLPSDLRVHATARDRVS